MADLAFFRLANQAPLPDPEFIANDLIGQAYGGAFLGDAGPTTEIDHEGAYEDFGGFVLVERGSLSGEDNPFGEYEARSDELLTYVVKDGDTLSSIASAFGLSVNNIKSANDKGTSLIKPGEELVILPVSTSGSVVKSTESETPPANDGYFIRPVDGGWNWGQLHDTSYMPAVDIGKACGSPIYAAASGKVLRVGSVDLYNQGYGGYILISHANGSRTLYSHNSENLVEVGDGVEQGEQIARVGNTGMTHGSTGCHVHFGVSGMSNPFAR